MQKILIKRIVFVILVALAALLILGYHGQKKVAQMHMAENSMLKLDQIVGTLQRNEEELRELTEELNEDYLARAHAFAYIIKQNPQVVYSQEELEHIKDFLQVDELHIIDANGILFAGTVPKYFGMDFRSTEQTAEFLQILDDPGRYLVQDIRPNGAEQKIFQYIGVSRQDQPGIVQIGLSPTRLLEAQEKNELSYIFSRVPVEAGSSLFAVNLDSGLVMAHSNPAMIGQEIEQSGVTVQQLLALENGGFYKQHNKQTYFVAKQYDDMALVYAQLEETLYEDRRKEMSFIFFYTLLTFFAVTYVINRLLKRQIVDGLHRIMRDLHAITDGNLETVVRVDNNPEFTQLSKDINHMVQGIISASGRVAKVIDMVDLQIGVFEYGEETDRVMASDRLRIVMDWSRQEADELYRQKQMFVNRLHDITVHCEAEQGGIYKISAQPEKWVRIHLSSAEGKTFGIAAEVTKDILEKRKIRHERDFDALTGLRNLTKFQQQVCAVLRHPEEIGVAAMVMLDLDCFKGINDQYGHNWGDCYLQITAKFLKEFDGKHGITSRRSGDEFYVFLYGYHTREEIAARIQVFYEQVRISQITFPDGSEKSLQVSSGVAWYDKTLCDFESLIKAADQALYFSKNHGRGKVSWYPVQE